MNNPYKTYWKYDLLVWIAIASFLPIGISSLIRFSKLMRADRIGDTETIENCKKHIRIGCWTILAFYVTVIAVTIIVENIEGYI